MSKRLPTKLIDKTYEGYEVRYEGSDEYKEHLEDYSEYINQLNATYHGGPMDSPEEPEMEPKMLTERQWNLLKKYMDQAQRRRSFRRGSKSMRSRSTGSRTTPGSIRLNIISRLIGVPQKRVLQYLNEPHL